MPDCHENIRNEKQEALKKVAGFWLLVAGCFLIRRFIFIHPWFIRKDLIYKMLIFKQLATSN
jgi:hypothetical protein